MFSALGTTGRVKGETNVITPLKIYSVGRLAPQTDTQANVTTVSRIFTRFCAV